MLAGALAGATWLVLFSWVAMAQPSGELLQVVGRSDVPSFDALVALLLDPGGTRLYAAAERGNAVFIFDRDPIAGTLALVQSLTGKLAGLAALNGPTSLGLGPDGASLFAAARFGDAILAFRPGPEGAFSLTGELRAGEGVPLDSPVYIAFAPGTSDLYAATSVSRGILRLRWDSASSPSPQFVAVFDPNPRGQNRGALLVCVLANNTTVLVGKTGAEYIQRFVRDPQDGHLAGQESVADPELMKAFERDARPAASSPDGNQVYVANEREYALVAYSRTGPDGALIPGEPVDVRPDDERDYFGARAIAISPDGTRVVCVSQFGPPLAVYGRAADGSLSALPPFGGPGDYPEGLKGARAAAFSPDGRRLYVASQFDSTVTVIEFDADMDGSRDLDEGEGDADSDGIPNFRDADSDDNGLPDAQEPQADLDGDGERDFLDLDDDGDGIPDLIEGSGDADDDGAPNSRDPDSDGNNVPDGDDGTADFDEDGIPDFIDLDDDDDRISGSIEGVGDLDGDGAPNYRDADADGDGIGDLAEGAWDTDLDGVIDSLEGKRLPAAGSVYLSQDADGDGISNGDEGYGDADKDGKPEYLDEDSDGNGVADATEGASDSDADGIPNYRDMDDDGDGIRDAVEGDMDTDGDGVPNRLDTDSDANGVEDGVEGDGDSDADGTPDYLDLDNDGDGVDDIVQGTSARPNIAAGGALATVQSLANGVDGVEGIGGAIDLVISPQGDRVYVAGFEDNAVAEFRLDRATGALTFSGAMREGRDGASGLDGPRALALSPEGNFLYVAAREGNTLAVYRVSPGN